MSQNISDMIPKLRTIFGAFIHQHKRIVSQERVALLVLRYGDIVRQIRSKSRKIIFMEKNPQFQIGIGSLVNIRLF